MESQSLGNMEINTKILNRQKEDPVIVSGHTLDSTPKASPSVKSGSLVEMKIEKKL